MPQAPNGLSVRQSAGQVVNTTVSYQRKFINQSQNKVAAPRGADHRVALAMNETPIKEESKNNSLLDNTEDMVNVGPPNPHYPNIIKTENLKEKQLRRA